MDNSSFMTTDRATHRKVIALAAAIAVAMIFITAHGRGNSRIEASYGKPAVQRLAAPKHAMPVALAELQ